MAEFRVGRRGWNKDMKQGIDTGWGEEVGATLQPVPPTDGKCETPEFESNPPDFVNQFYWDTAKLIPLCTF